MKTKSIGFIGGGRITRIILQAIQNKQFDLSSVIVSDTNQEMLDKLKKQFHDIQVTTQNVIAAKQEYVIIALHPPAIMGVLEEVKEEISASATIFSLAPKITIQKIQSAVNILNVARLIPNATSIINEGYNPVCFSKEFKKSDKGRSLKWLKQMGPTFEVDEQKLEAYALVSAMAPTYFWFQWQKLVELGTEFGLDSSESEQAVYQSMMAALNVQFNDNLSYKEIRDLIPVKPIGELEEDINEIYETKLKALFAKISTQS
jgi:pyrroline-5-carboxylate reductase